MRAVVLEGPGRISLEDVRDPAPGPGEALIDVKVAGICGTDLQLARGYMGFTGIPGHEFVGTVAVVNSHADKLLIGARVVGEINIGCEECALCAEGLQRHCGRRRVLGILGKEGAFAERLTLPIRNLHAVPGTISDSQAVFIEPIAAALEILDQVVVARSERILVLGDGKLGLLVAQALATRGSDVTVAGHHEAKLALARELGLKAVTPAGLSGTRPFDLVVEATGRPEGLDLALTHVRPRGTVVMKTTSQGPAAFEAWRAVVNEITLVGSRCGRFEPAIEALVSGDIKVDPLVTAELPLDDGMAAFDKAREPGALKVLLRVAR
ncbi:MAG TPA: alcohol dehydrogenase catalytic domain-containing protein [Patescibacteria group bacterium]|nr:alcohol dehydrogenase catalytic domain-containing protein [Patescibacteria group bacterium]